MNPSGSAGHWAAMGESTFIAGIWMLYAVHRLLGRWPFLLCLYPVVTAHWLLRSSVRSASMQYLARLEEATGALGHAPTWRDSLRHVALFAETLLDKLLAASGRYPLRGVRSVGAEPILDAIRAGEGGVIVTAHLGCLELCQALAEQQPDFRLTVLVHTRNAVRFNRILHRLHAGPGLELVEVTELGPAAALLLADRVTKGGYVAIAGDRVPVGAGRTVSIDFLGHPAPFPVGPYVLASLMKCPLYLLVCLHEGDGYALHFARLAGRVELARDDRETALAEHATRYVRALEGLIRLSPYDWFNFFPFWDQPHAPAPD